MDEEAKRFADIEYRDCEASRNIAAALLEGVKAHAKSEKYEPVFVNVGATSSTGDALGPFVGWFLRRKGFAGKYVGDLDAPCHATNLKERVNDAWTLAMRDNKFPLIIGVDAAVGRPGRITINDGPLKPGAGMAKHLQAIGSLHLMGGTAITPATIWFAGIEVTVAMAEVIADGIIEFYSAWSAERGVA